MTGQLTVDGNCHGLGQGEAVGGLESGDFAQRVDFQVLGADARGGVFGNQLDIEFIDLCYDEQGIGTGITLTGGTRVRSYRGNGCCDDGGDDDDDGGGGGERQTLNPCSFPKDIFQLRERERDSGLTCGFRTECKAELCWVGTSG